MIRNPGFFENVEPGASIIYEKTRVPYHNFSSLSQGHIDFSENFNAPKLGRPPNRLITRYCLVCGIVECIGGTMFFFFGGDPPNLGDFPPTLVKIPRSIVPTSFWTSSEIDHHRDLQLSHENDFCTDRELRIAVFDRRRNNFNAISIAH